MKLNIKLGKLKERLRRYVRYLYLLGVIALAGGGGYVAYLGDNAGNPLLILVGFAGMAGGFILFLSWRRMGSTRIVLKRDADGKEIEEDPPNSLILYPDWLEFSYIENPLGQAQKDYNDGKYYYVLKSDKPFSEKEKRTLSEFRLPDDDEQERCYCPREFANVVTMISNKKYFAWSASLMQQISVGIMAIVIAGEIIGLIAIV